MQETSVFFIQGFVLICVMACAYAYMEFTNSNRRLPRCGEILGFLEEGGPEARNFVAILVFAAVIGFLWLLSVVNGEPSRTARVESLFDWFRISANLLILTVLAPVMALRVSAGILMHGDLVGEGREVPTVGLVRLAMAGGWKPDVLGARGYPLVVLQILLLGICCARVFLLWV
jgi:hypothetical protein